MECVSLINLVARCVAARKRPTDGRDRGGRFTQLIERDKRRLAVSL